MLILTLQRSPRRSCRNPCAPSRATVGTASLEQLVIDDDIYERMLRVCEGFEVSTDTLGLEVLASVGHNRQFLAEPHMLKYLRREFHPAKLATRLNPEAWVEAGAEDSAELASMRVKEILAGLHEPHLETRVATELAYIAALAEKA